MLAWLRRPHWLLDPVLVTGFSEAAGQGWETARQGGCKGTGLAREARTRPDGSMQFIFTYRYA